ncbi:alpha/beta fold hydrolase [Chryseobacterium rhizosphaerae]|jgi:Predicted hydrolases or acyltransferases (alpha/beta hydrolase superfamily)|uniref:Pimeloyl-ACP methyl ester carboxylesterase n=1 Tax=Chryseobacterium rhizosphaerae TaxID=395937 RepID=A0AAE3YAW3_9FLAO|nr:alpha/beta hydrolase [Chryseobacterium rhizosphaerae]MDC8099318.1 alpha/beta hydrolase [Chryseobacterium rhizosphaerae]MDR6528778.1 pimeloyl-ACP methyl ester carboxylesterase [Chryseobacterium rhizosphaerae]
MPIITVNNRQVHIQELNKDAEQTVVLIHGMFSNLSIYYFNIAPILAKHFHVVMYDLKSHGMSERFLNGYDLDTMSSDLISLIDHLQLEKVHLVGYSFGGLIALKTALEYPNRINQMAVMEAPDPQDEKARNIIDEYSKEFLEHYVANFTDTTKVQMGKRQMEKNHRMYEFLFNQTSIKADMIKEKHFLGEAPLTELAVPTLLVYGAESNCRPTGEWLQTQISTSELELIPGDHNIPIQEPHLIAETIVHFLSKILTQNHG